METLAKLEELEQKFGENPRRYFAALANEYRKNGEFEQAIELCRAQLEQQPDHLSGRVVLGQALFDAFHYEEARTELTTALELDPENFIALRLLGELAAQDGDQETARDFFSRARDIEPRNEQLLAALAALGPAEPPPTLAEAVARTKTAPQPVFEEPMEPTPKADAVADAAMTAAEPVAEPPVERFPESAFAPPTRPAVGGASVGSADEIGAKAKGPALPELPMQSAADAAAPPVPDPPPEGPLRRELPVSPAEEAGPAVQRVEGLVPPTVEPEHARAAAAEPVTPIEAKPPEAQPSAPAVESRTVETRDVEAEEIEAEEIEAEEIEAEEIAAEPVGTESDVRAVAQEDASLETATPPEPRPTIVTETMADLYLEQGHRSEAIEVLRQLVSQRPEDERLSRRLAELEATPAVPTVRDFFARLGARGGIAPASTAVATQQSKGSLSALLGESGSTVPDPESAALVAVTMPEPAATPTDNEFENWVSRRRKP